MNTKDRKKKLEDLLLTSSEKITDTFG